MIDSVNELIDDLTQTPEILKKRLAEHEDAQPQSPDNWGPVEIVAHMAENERVQRTRMQEILTKHVPYLKDWSPEAAIEQRDPSSLNVTGVLEDFVDQRGDTLVLLVNLALKDWDKTGVSDTMGEVSIEDLASDLIEHDEQYVKRLEEVLAQQ